MVIITIIIVILIVINSYIIIKDNDNDNDDEYNAQNKDNTKHIHKKIESMSMIFINDNNYVNNK